jgi:hypothetical protein
MIIEIVRITWKMSINLLGFGDAKILLSPCERIYRFFPWIESKGGLKIFGIIKF